MPLGLPTLGILVLAPEPAAEEGRAHALPTAIAPGIIDVFPRCVRLTQQADQRVILVVPDDAQERITRWQAQDLSHLPHRLLYSLRFSGTRGLLRFWFIRLLPAVGGGGMRILGIRKGDHVVWGPFTFTFT